MWRTLYFRNLMNYKSSSNLKFLLSHLQKMKHLSTKKIAHSLYETGFNFTMFSWLMTNSRNYHLFTNDENPSGSEEISTIALPNSCALCQDIKNHEESIQKSINASKKNRPKVGVY